MGEVVKVLVVDDHREFRLGLVALLSVEHALEVVGEAATGEEAVARARALQPDVVLMDLAMPGMDGIQATRELLATSPHVGVVALTMHADDTSVLAALRAGARGYVLKGARRAEIVRTIRAVADGDALLGPGLAHRLHDYVAAPVQPPDAFPQLAPRERQVLQLLAEHVPNAAIARRLGLSEKTVRNLVSAVLTKLQVPDRAAAILAARDAGLVRARPRG